MPDNRQLIKERLGELGLRPRREEEILRELGNYLEDSAEELAVRGVPYDAAIREGLDSVSDWASLRREIVLVETEEGTMNYRTRVLWLPGVCIFLLNVGFLAALQIAGLQPRIYWLSKELFIPIYIPWLLMLPVLGAIAAFWSKRAGGKGVHLLLAPLAPLIIFLGAFLAMFFTLAFVIDRHVPLSLKIEGLLIYILVWVLLPSCALCLGAIPLLRKPHPQA